MGSQANAAPRRKRRWLQFSLRTMLAATLVLGLLCGWIGTKVHRARREQIWVEAIRAGGGTVAYHYQAIGGGWFAPGGTEPPGPRPLRMLPPRPLPIPRRLPRSWLRGLP